MDAAVQWVIGDTGKELDYLRQQVQEGLDALKSTDLIQMASDGSVDNLVKVAKSKVAKEFFANYCVYSCIYEELVEIAQINGTHMRKLRANPSVVTLGVAAAFPRYQVCVWSLSSREQSVFD